MQTDSSGLTFRTCVQVAVGDINHKQCKQAVTVRITFRKCNQNSLVLQQMQKMCPSSFNAVSIRAEHDVNTRVIVLKFLKSHGGCWYLGSHFFSLSLILSTNEIYKLLNQGEHGATDHG